MEATPERRLPPCPSAKTPAASPATGNTSCPGAATRTIPAAAGCSSSSLTPWTPSTLPASATSSADLYFFDAARYLRLQHPEVTIEAAIPYSGQADRWRPELRERYAYDLRQCDYQTLVQEAYTPGCMMRRNRYMVDASRILIAAFDGRPGGTARTLEYAARRRLEIIQIPIDSAPVGI